MNGNPVQHRLFKVHLGYRLTYRHFQKCDSKTKTWKVSAKTLATFCMTLAKSLDFRHFRKLPIRKKKTLDAWLDAINARAIYVHWKPVSALCVTGTRNGMRHFRPKSLDLGSSGSAIRKKTLGQCWKRTTAIFCMLWFCSIVHRNSRWLATLLIQEFVQQVPWYA